MRKISIMFITIVLVVCSVINVSADTIVGNVYQVNNTTIIFENNSEFSNEQQEMIAQLLVNPEYAISPANLICDIFGHKNTTEGVTTITHRVSAMSPRCLQENFIVTTCSRCNASTVERASYFYITCCPED